MEIRTELGIASVRRCFSVDAHIGDGLGARCERIELRRAFGGASGALAGALSLRVHRAVEGLALCRKACGTCHRRPRCHRFRSRRRRFRSQCRASIDIAASSAATGSGRAAAPLPAVFPPAVPEVPPSLLPPLLESPQPVKASAKSNPRLQLVEIVLIEEAPVVGKAWVCCCGWTTTRNVFATISRPARSADTPRSTIPARRPRPPIDRSTHRLGVGGLELADHAPPIVGEVAGEPARSVRLETGVEAARRAMVLLVGERGIEMRVRQSNGPCCLLACGRWAHSLCCSRATTRLPCGCWGRRWNLRGNAEP